MRKIHPTAIVSKEAKIADNVEIGPYSIIGDNVEIAENTIVKSHVVIEGFTKIGKNNIIFPFAAIGQDPQDLKFSGENSRIIIGDNNRIREYVTIHPGTKDGGMQTVIGNDCLFMVSVHIAHDCIIGNKVILANNATLAGHVEIADDVIIGGLSAVHQFTRIGKGAMVGGMSGVESDVIPYGMVMGERAFLAGLNLVGMRRHKLPREEIHALRHFFKKMFEEKNSMSFMDKAEISSKEFTSDIVNEVVSFIKSESSRSFCQPKNNLKLDD